MTLSTVRRIAWSGLTLSAFAAIASVPVVLGACDNKNEHTSSSTTTKTTQTPEGTKKTTETTEKTTEVKPKNPD